MSGLYNLKNNSMRIPIKQILVLFAGLLVLVAFAGRATREEEIVWRINFSELRTPAQPVNTAVPIEELAGQSVKPGRAEPIAKNRDATPTSDLRSDPIDYGLSLAQAGDDKSIEKLFQLLEQTSDAAQREALVQCFSAISSPSAKTALLGRLREEATNASVVLAAETGLAAIGHLGFVEEVPQLMEKWTDKEFQLRLQVAVSLVTNAACVRAVTKTATYGLLGGQPNLAGAGAHALANMGTPEADEQLVILAGMPDFPSDQSEVLQRVRSEKARPGLQALAEGRLLFAAAETCRAARQALSNYPLDITSTADSR
ncbi:MAG: hypothetical protein A2X46_15240 [Lentisphaerae bacterium GWF2_57_35]|nr:MAG: hypothetical protein A2X46_15240 [Lentisphaerae bacterium GWF2_57_35]